MRSIGAAKIDVVRRIDADGECNKQDVLRTSSIPSLHPYADSEMIN